MFSTSLIRSSTLSHSHSLPIHHLKLVLHLFLFGCLHNAHKTMSGRLCCHVLGFGECWVRDGAVTPGTPILSCYISFPSHQHLPGGWQSFAQPLLGDGGKASQLFLIHHQPVSVLWPIPVTSQCPGWLKGHIDVGALGSLAAFALCWGAAGRFLPSLCLSFSGL